MAAFILHFSDSPEHGYIFWDYGAAGKYHYDREKFAAEIGVQRMDAYMYTWEDEPEDVINARMDGILAGLKRYDTVFMQWPLPVVDQRWLQKLFSHIRAFGAYIVLIIDDMLTWRDQPVFPAPDTQERETWLNNPSVQIEMNFIPQVDGIITHSTAMAEHLREQMAIKGREITDNIAIYGPGGNASTYFQPPRTLGHGVDYAGNLIYAKFLYELPQDFKINVYGASPDELDLAQHPNISLTPRVDPEAINQLLHGSFGLVWSSDSYPEATGVIADYMHYNSSAKLSMYLAADEPVIVWREASFAPFIEANHLGLVIDDLSQLPDTLAAVSEEDYHAMIARVQAMGPLIRNGFFLKKAMFDVLGKLYDQSQPK